MTSPEITDAMVEAAALAYAKACGKCNRRGIRAALSAALAQEGGGDEELPPNYAACCNSTDLASCDCVNKQHIRALFAKGGRE